MTYIFNRKEWAEFYMALTHRHVFDSDHGYLSVGTATLLRCKCGRSEWAGLGPVGMSSTR